RGLQAGGGDHRRGRGRGLFPGRAGQGPERVAAGRRVVGASRGTYAPVMKISILRGGGLAGIVTRTELDAQRLPPDAARTLERLVASAGPLEEPAQVASEASLPDELQYEVTLEDEHGRQTAHFGDAPPDWAPPDHVLVSEDAALSTTMASILAERELTPTALEATALALGIHEDTGSLTYPGTTQRDADALGWCLRHGASQELVAAYLHTPLSHAESDVLRTLLDTATTVEVGGIDVLVAGAVTRESDVSVSTLAHKL